MIVGGMITEFITELLLKIFEAIWVRLFLCKMKDNIVLFHEYYDSFRGHCIL